MKKLSIIFILFLLSACTQPSFESIDPSVDFLASLNTGDGSINFLSEEREIIGTWQLDKAYTGFSLVTDDLILVYGFTMNEAVIFQLSTGKQVSTIEVAEGTTNSYVYNDEIYIANGKENTISHYNLEGKLLEQTSAGDYPMSMVAEGKNLYVVNFKDEKLSVFTLDLKEVTEWDIPSSSQGILVNGDEIWLGGHGVGSSPNRVISRYDRATGKLVGEIETPVMPIMMTTDANGFIYALSHGSSTLYKMSETGEVLTSIKAGANPFSVAIFGKSAVIAGYEDHQVYFIESGKVTDKVPVGKGPFQLIVREASK